MMVKKVFDMLEEHKFDIEHFSVRVTKEDITSKDGRILSQKQANCLYNYFNLNIGKTLRYIHNNDYIDIFKRIGSILHEWSCIDDKRINDFHRALGNQVE